MIRFIFLLGCLLVNVQVYSMVKPDLKVDVFSSGYADPLAIRNDGENPWLYIVQRNGEIYIANESGVKQAAPFLNITSKVLSGGERGLLGLAFHPQFSENRLFVVNYTRRNDGATVIATYKASESNPMLADPVSEKVLLTVSQPYANHNGGDIHFGADGYLYIGMGDGGSGGDPQNYAQNPQSLLGKMLRIHLNSDSTYIIPEDNPYANSTTHLKEIWAMGLRNPWRFSFDRLNDDLWIADVGQSAREEVNVAKSPRAGGENYGWRCYEGEQGYNTSGCQSSSAYVAPVFTYNRTNATGGQSITGGYVYRGSRFPDMYGYYVFADYISRNFWLLKADGESTDVILKNNVLATVTSFGEDISGELYVASFNGNIYQVGSECSDLKLSSVDITPLNCPSESIGEIVITMDRPSDEYDFLWSTGATGPEISDLEAGFYHVQVTDSKGCVLTDSFEVTALKEIPEIILSGDSLWSDIEGTYQWWVDDVLIDGADEAYIIPQTSGSYQVEVTDESGCKLLSDIFELNLNAVRNQALPEDLQVFPNPAKDAVMVMTPEYIRAEQATLRIFDLNGRVVFEDHHRDVSAPISLSKLPSGHYIIELSSDDTGYRGLARVAKVEN